MNPPDENNNRFALSIIETLREALLILDENENVVYANRAFYRNFKVSKEETIGKPLFLLGNKQWDIAELRQLLYDIISSGVSVEGFTVKHRFEHIGEKVMLLNARSLLLQEERSYILLAIEDITERFNTQAQLEFSEKRYRTLIEEANSIVIILDNNQNISFINHFCEKAVGYHLSEIIGKPLLETIIPSVDSRGTDNRQMLHDVFTDPHQFSVVESEAIRKDGSRLWFAWSARALYDEAGRLSELLIDGHDITSLVETREELEEKSATLDTLLRYIPEGIMITDELHRVRTASESVREILGVTKEQLLETDEQGRLELMHLYWPDSNVKIRPDELPLSKSTQSGEVYTDYEMVQKRNGTVKVLSVNAAPIRDKSGRVTGAIGAWRDITEQQKRLLEIAERKRVLDALMEYSPVGIMLADKEGKIFDVNKLLSGYIGLPEEDIVGREEQPEQWGILDPSTGKTPHYHFMPLCRAVKRQESVHDEEFLMMRDGKELVFAFSATPILDENGETIGGITIWRDITEQKRLHKEHERQRNLLEQVINEIPVAIALHEGPEFITSLVNPAYRAISKGKGDVLGKRVADVWPELAGWHIPVLKQVYETGEPYHEVDREMTIDRGNGPEKAWFTFSYLPFYGEDRKITAILLWSFETTMHVRARKEIERSQEQLRAQSELLETIIDTIPVMITVYDPQLQKIELNKAFEEITGWKREDIGDRNIMELVYPDPDYRREVAAYMQSLEPGFRDFRLRRKDGSDLESSWANTRLPDGRQVGIGIDITERKKAEQAIRESEYQFRQLADSMPQLVFVTRPDGYHDYFNKPWYDFTGTSPGETQGELWSRLLHPDDYQRTLDQWNHSLQTGEPYQIEYRFRRGKDGSYHWFLGRALPVRNEKGNITRWFGTCTYIQEQKETEQALRESEERFRTLADNISQLVWMASPQGKIFWYNKRWYDFTGLTPEVMQKDGMQTVVHPDYIHTTLSSFHQSISMGTPWELSFPMRDKEGTYKWFLSRAMPIRNEEGNIIRWFGTNTDISDIKRVQEELLVSAERFQRITSSSIIGTLVGDHSGKISFANDTFLHMIGYSREEFQQKMITWKQITPPEYESHDTQALKELQKSGVATPYEKEYLRKDGSRIWVLIAVTILPGPQQEIFAFILDITERKAALEEAQRGRAEVEAILYSIPDGYIIYDNDGHIVRMNNRAREVIGISEKNAESTYEERMRDLKVLNPEGKSYPLENIPSWRAIRYGETTRDVEMKIQRADREYWISVSASPIAADGRQLGAIMEFSDITRQHYLQEQLAGERNFVNAILQTSGALISVLDKNMRIVRFNRACEQLTGYSADEMLNLPVLKLIPPDELEGVKAVAERLKTGEMVNEYENHWLTSQGEKRFIRWRNSVLLNDQGEVEFLIATGIDISDRRALEKELNNRAEELASANRDLESFSYSVSHDLRGPLGIVKGFSSILEEDFSDCLDEEGRDYLHRINGSVNKMSQIIESLLSLSRMGRQQMKREDIDLSAMVSSFLRELSELNPERPTDFIIEENVHAYADKNMIQTALDNLLRNAWKFTSKKDVTRIEFGVYVQDGKTIYYVRDNGVGFDMQSKETIFEPFRRGHAEKEFSGTGVGLSIVQRAIKRHGGRIWAEGEIDRGATFFFTL